MNIDFERALKVKYNFICGIDEAGRGPLAGPVVAAAVILPDDFCLEGINDSKKLSEKKREEFFDKITECALSYSIAFVDEKRIDEINILQATFEAMLKAADSLSIKPDILLIDGNMSPKTDIHVKTVVKGDSKILSIAAASILAKVSRDRYMNKLSKKYPSYNFEKHKGYGTKLHYEMIEKNGISDVHRKSFLKKLTGNIK